MMLTYLLFPVTRGCAASANWLDDCKEGEVAGGFHGTNCYCNTDGCNAATVIGQLSVPIAALYALATTLVF